MESKLKECKKHGITEYHLVKNGKKGNIWKCLKCQKEAVLRRRNVLKLKSIEYKGGKCQICGYDKCIGALEFHHIDPTKKNFSISEKGLTRSFSLIKAELDKCILLCSNCHKEVHAGLIDVKNLI